MYESIKYSNYVDLFKYYTFIILKQAFYLEHFHFLLLYKCCTFTPLHSIYNFSY